MHVGPHTVSPDVTKSLHSSASYFLSSVSQHATAVEVYEGAESVLLPCQLLAAPSEFTAAVWDREDRNIPTVHVRVKSGDDLDDQNQRYTN